MGWKICSGLLVLVISALAQNVTRHHDVQIFPFNGTIGQLCFEEASGGNKICLKAQTMAADVTMELPSSSSVGNCLGGVSATALGNIACAGGTGITQLNGLNDSSQTFSTVDDTNVTLTISSGSGDHQFVVGWTGALAKTRQHSATVYNDQSNTYLGGTQDFGAAALKIPYGPGLAHILDGYISYNSTLGVVNIGRGAFTSNRLIQAPNSTAVNNIPAYADIYGRELGAGYSTSILSNPYTLPIRTDYGRMFPRDGGEQVFNVKAYGAVADNSTDDAPEINSARSAAESAGGGIVFLPAGRYCINSSIVAGDGSASADNTKPPVIIQGAGAALNNTTPQGTTLRWCGGAQGSKTPMIKFAGPYGGGGIKDLTLEAGNNTNVVGIDGQQWGQGFIENVSITGVNGGDALKYYSVRVSGITPSNNIVKSLYINSPGTNGNGVYLTGGTTELMKDAASNQFIGGSWWGTEYALKLEFADGNIFDVSQFQIVGTPDGTNCGIKFVRSTVDAAFPSGNYFRTPFTKGYCGTTGNGKIPNAFIPLGECDYPTYCNPKTAITSGIPMFQISFPNLFNAFRGLYGMEARGDSATSTDPVFYFDNVSGSHSYTGAIAHSKDGVVQALTLTHLNDGHVFMSKSSAGAGSLEVQGYLSSWGELYLRPIPRASLTSYNPPRGAQVHCDGCAADSSCTASAGNSAIATRLNTSGSFPTGWTCQ